MVASDPAPESAAEANNHPDPVATVWCRQVDNEAESPGYTALPNDFPGYQETMDTIRIVGNLAINVADTHDYWDPDPNLPLSYYRNLFLYAAHGGTYTCLGRMFLSTEDRPRLGMKTLVLDTARLLGSPEFGATVLHWYESMGGGRPDDRPPPVPDPRLYSVLGEGFLFHRGTTDPVLVIASEEWEAAVETIFDYVRALPASLLTLGAILAFPYFLPEPKTNLTDFCESIPLSLALMRVPRSEASGDRHRKRVQSWTAAPVTLHDLTVGTPAPAGKSGEKPPLIAQYVRDHNLAKLGPVTERVDRVELRSLRARLADPERQGGKDRRKAMWRLATAMESAALLLQRSRGRKLDLPGEATRRAHEYLEDQAKPAVAEESALFGGATPEVASAAATASADAQLPPWLQRSTGPVPIVQRTARVEVVPMSVKDDPSLLKGPETAQPEPTALQAREAPPELVGTARIPDFAQLRRVIEADLLRYIDERVAAGGTAITARSLKTLEDRLSSRLLAAIEPRLPAVSTGAPATLEQVDSMVQERLKTTLADLGTLRTEGLRDLKSTFERRFSEWSGEQQQSLGSLADRLLARAAELEARLTQEQANQIAQSEERIRGEIRAILSEEFEREMQSVLDPRIEQLKGRAAENLRQSLEAMRADLKSETEQVAQGIQTRAQASEENLRAALTAQAELHRRETEEHAQTTRAEVAQKLQELLVEHGREAGERQSKDVQEAERRLALLIDGRAREIQDRVQTGQRENEAKFSGQLDEQLAAVEARVDRKGDLKLDEFRESEMHTLADLQVRLQSYADQKLKEGQDREREKYLELLARLKGEVETAIGRAADAGAVDRMVREQFQRSADVIRNDIQRLIDLRAMATEERFGRDHADVTQRLDTIRSDLEDRGRETNRLENAIRVEMDELDRKIVVLTDRLIPIVRKAWLRIADIERGTSSTAEAELKYAQLRREFTQDVRRLETDLAERTREIRERVEGAIANQGRVWLTLVRQLSQMTEERRAAEERESVGLLSAAGGTPSAADLQRQLDQISSMARAARGEATADPSADAPEESPSRRKGRRSSSR